MKVIEATKNLVGVVQTTYQIIRIRMLRGQVPSILAVMKQIITQIVPVLDHTGTFIKYVLKIYLF